MSANNRLKTIILGNKCDSVVMSSDGTYTMDDEHRDIFEKQMIPTIQNEMKSHNIQNDRFKIIPFCSRIIYIYRTLHNLNSIEKANIIGVLKNTDNFEELNKLGYLNFKHLEEIMINDLGKIKWNRMTHEQKVKRLEKMLAINNQTEEIENDELVEMSGGHLLFELTHKFMDKNELINNIIFRLFSYSDPFDNINEMKNIKNIKISKKSNKNKDFQKALIQKTIEYLKIDDIYFKLDNIDVWSIMLIDIHEILTQYDLHICDSHSIFQRGKKALQDYIEHLYRFGFRDLSNKVDYYYIYKIFTVLEPYVKIIELLMKVSIKEAIFNIQYGLYIQYIGVLNRYIERQSLSNKVLKPIDKDISQIFNVCTLFSIEHSLETEIFLKLYDCVIDNGLFEIVFENNTGILNNYIYMLETLKYINKEYKNNISIKSRIICLKFVGKKIESVQSIEETTRILRSVYDFENNNYYKILMKTIIEGNKPEITQNIFVKDNDTLDDNGITTNNPPVIYSYRVSQYLKSVLIMPQKENGFEEKTPEACSVQGEESSQKPSIVLDSIAGNSVQPAICDASLDISKLPKQSDFQKLISVAQKKPCYSRYKSRLLRIVLRNKDNYPIYNFISPFMSTLKSDSFRYFYQALQQPQRQCDWEMFIHNVVLEAENGNTDLTQMLELIINKF